MVKYSANDIKRLERQLAYHESKCQTYDARPGIYNHHSRVAAVLRALLKYHTESKP